MMREVDDSCAHRWDGDFLKLDVPACTITHRLLIDEDWHLAMMGALELAVTIKQPEGPEQDRAINKYLDCINLPMSALERRIIFTYATGRNEA